MANNLVLMNAMASKMDWLEARQKALAQNIANADTPGARPVDIAAPDFKSMLGASTSSLSLGAPHMTATSGKHLGLGGTAVTPQQAREKAQKTTYEVAPAGNAVVLEEQLLKMNENFSEHRLITNLYQKNVDMLEKSVK
jgi:flagellar basal-body rod protein FlgB